MNDRLKSLYKTVIVKHNNDPVHFEKNESAQFVIKANSPICGDRFTLYFNIENGVLKNLSFYGHGCAISKASTSILVQKMIDQPIEKVLEICEDFYTYVHPENEAPSLIIEEFEAFSAVKFFPGRMQCATLSWNELDSFLKAQK